MKYTLPPLPYAYDALEPFIDARTMEIHHTKHHAAYVEKLNAALGKHPEVAETPLEALLSDLTKVPEDIRTAVRNHGGGHLNHSMFWTMMASQGVLPPAPLVKALENTFGSMEKFKGLFANVALGHFGSGWAWLTLSKVEGLAIITTPNQDSPLMQGFAPLLGLDVWEHAYYLKYQNKRADYIENWWNIVNWGEVEKRYGLS
ncbi:MAG: superoxide dismutase [Candidatus Jorgensenbacteria bacterium]|nr:superoxide dismutase [Candidatus Jorgensenbacteria bacterium]